MHGLRGTAASVHFRPDANDHAHGNNRTTVYAPATFYWTGRPRQRTILDSKVHRRRAYQPAEQHSPKRRRDIAIGGEDGGGSRLKLGSKAPGISIPEVCGKLIRRYIVKSYTLRATERRRERTVERGEVFRRRLRRESRRFCTRFISAAALIYPPHQTGASRLISLKELIC